MNANCAPFQSAGGLAQSKTWRTSLRPRRARSVLDCGSPLPLFGRDHCAGRRLVFSHVACVSMPKRQRAGAVPDLAEFKRASGVAKRLGVR